MRVFVTAKPGSKKRFIKKIDENHFTVAVCEAPFKGYANKAIVEALADFLNLPKSRVILVSGSASRQKVFEII